MTNVIMHGCNGKMGKNIANLIKEDEVIIALHVVCVDR